MKAFYTILEEEISEVHDYWNDKDFITELDKRSAVCKSGKVKAVPWKEAKEQIIGSTKKREDYRETRVDEFPFVIIYEVLKKEQIVFVSYVFHYKRTLRIKYMR